MADLEVLLLLLAWVATFGLLVVVPWVVVRVVAGVLEVDVGAVVDRWTPSVREPADDVPDEIAKGATTDEHPTATDHADETAEEHVVGRPSAGLERDR